MRRLVLVALLALLLSGCKVKSCAEQGGVLVYSHSQPVPVGKSFVLLPVYRCDLPKES